MNLEKCFNSPESFLFARLRENDHIQALYTRDAHDAIVCAPRVNRHNRAFAPALGIWQILAQVGTTLLVGVERTPCGAIPGVSCSNDATIETLDMTKGHWCHSGASSETHPCESDGDWTPCLGDVSAANDSDGYCMPGYRGVRCEICDSSPDHPQYFE